MQKHRQPLPIHHITIRPVPTGRHKVMLVLPVRTSASPFASAAHVRGIVGGSWMDGDGVLAPVSVGVTRLVLDPGDQHELILGVCGIDGLHPYVAGVDGLGQIFWRERRVNVYGVAITRGVMLRHAPRQPDKRSSNGSNSYEFHTYNDAY